MKREKKFHIYNSEHEPLCYDDRVLEFDTFNAALKFLQSLDCDEGITINEDILYYDGGYFDATGLAYDSETDELVEASQ